MPDVHIYRLLIDLVATFYLVNTRHSYDLE